MTSTRTYEHAVRVETTGLTKRFRRGRAEPVVAVDHLDLTARTGEILGLLGANGAGKTTFLRLLATMLQPTAGDARVCGHSVTTAPQEVRRRIGFMSGTTSLYGRLTAREMITYCGRLHGLTEERIAARLDELFPRFGIQDFADVRCDHLSTGMRQKVSIARTVLHDPDVMIFDEPTAGLDLLASQAIMEFVIDCRAAGKCVLFSTHRMDEITTLCDRVAVIHQGRLRCCESVTELAARAPSGRLGDAFLALVGEA